MADDKYKVVKIRPGWELANTDDKGNMYFEFSNIPSCDLEHNQRVSDKVMKEMENRQKL